MDDLDASIQSIQKILKIGIFKTPPKGGILSEQNNSDYAFQMRNDVKICEKYPQNIEEIIISRDETIKKWQEEYDKEQTDKYEKWSHDKIY